MVVRSTGVRVAIEVYVHRKDVFVRSFEKVGLDKITLASRASTPVFVNTLAHVRSSDVARNKVSTRQHDLPFAVANHPVLVDILHDDRTVADVVIASTTEHATVLARTRLVLAPPGGILRHTPWCGRTGRSWTVLYLDTGREDPSKLSHSTGELTNRSLFSRLDLDRGNRCRARRYQVRGASFQNKECSLVKGLIVSNSPLNPIDSSERDPRLDVDCCGHGMENLSTMPDLDPPPLMIGSMYRQLFLVVVVCFPLPVNSPEQLVDLFLFHHWN